MFKMTLNIKRKIILAITFLLAVSATVLPSICSTASASIDYSDSATEEQEPFKILVTIGGVKGHCGEEVTITETDKSGTYQLCEGDERPYEEQRADPISSEGHEIVFPKGQIAVGESFDVCVEISYWFSDCETLTNSTSKQPEEVTFSID
jgi:hypothetical protein